MESRCDGILRQGKNDGKMKTQDRNNGGKEVHKRWQRWDYIAESGRGNIKRKVDGKRSVGILRQGKNDRKMKTQDEKKGERKKSNEIITESGRGNMKRKVSGKRDLVRHGGKEGRTGK